ncbi:hypothetical protein GDO81_006900 [Engystomops pustulosus]|uniref:Uncharacterized protein n=1 Tax=Engystomops pustulosus TaxID=76066 RepID=A0AAV7D047_ENGPU|nr:hypothetical protein GDO81_006900 [Engystomops pustulosus]
MYVLSSVFFIFCHPSAMFFYLTSFPLFYLSFLLLFMTSKGSNSMWRHRWRNIDVFFVTFDIILVTFGHTGQVPNTKWCCFHPLYCTDLKTHFSGHL